MRNKETDAVRIAARKRRIMEAGFRLFLEKGFEAVTMPEIAAASGVSRASLYLYYSTKVDLVIAVGAWKWDEYIRSAQASKATERAAATTAAARMRLYLESFLDLYRNHRDLLCFNYVFNIYLKNVGSTSEQKKTYLDVVENLRVSFHEIFEQGRMDHTIRTDISEEMMFSSSFHIMLAATTRYAVGLVYLPESGTSPEDELIMLENLLLSKFVQQEHTAFL